VTRTRASAKRAGNWMQRLVADYLHHHVDDGIDVRAKRGSKDRGDIGGLKHMGQRVVVEVKNTTRWMPATWLAEAEVERRNDDAGVGLVICKRVGKGQPEDQLVMMTMADFVSLLTGHRPDDGDDT
jgi:hypothetical protein